MVGKLIARGVMVGIVAALFAFGFAKEFGEPAVSVAIQLETEHANAARDSAIKAGQVPLPVEDEMFSRDIQSGVGLLTGLVGVGAGIGALVGVLFAVAHGRLGSLDARATAALVALLGLATLYLVPALKYPPNPPTVGAPDTIRLRTGLYFLMIGLSLLATGLGLGLRARLLARFGAWNASVMASLGYVAMLCVAFLALPSVNEVPPDFPAVAMWNFRIASLGIQTILWLGTGIMFGYASGMPTSDHADRLPRDRHAPSRSALP